MRLLLLDKYNDLECVGTIDSKQIMNELGINEKQFKLKLNCTEFVYNEKYVLVEESFEDERIKEISTYICETDNRIYYVTNYGNVYCIYKKSKKKRYLSRLINSRNDVTVVINRKTYVVKNLVAKYYCKEWKPGYIVKLKDNDPWNLRYDNLNIIKKEFHFRAIQHDRVQKKVDLFKEGKHIKSFQSIKDAAKYIHVDRSHLSKILKRKVNNNTGYDFKLSNQ